MPQQEHRPRDETRNLILEALAQADDPLTRTEIARALHRRKSPHLIAMIDELVDDGLIVRDVVTFHNGVQGYVYALAAR